MLFGSFRVAVSVLTGDVTGLVPVLFADSLFGVPLWRVLLLCWFVGFFVVTGIVFLFDTPSLRRTYIAVVLVVLFVLNVAGLSAAPLVDIQPYGPAAPTEYDIIELRVVDAQGTELRLDTRAVPPYTGSRLGWVAYQMVTEADDRRAIGSFVVSRANDYRRDVLDDSPLDAVRFPSHVDDYRWTPERLEATGPFVGVRVYHLELTVSDDGRRVVERSETLVLEEWYDSASSRATDSGPRETMALSLRVSEPHRLQAGVR